jgi:hypothetical protein
MPLALRLIHICSAAVLVGSAIFALIPGTSLLHHGLF